MRAFIAIPLPTEVKDILFDIQNQVGNDYAKIKWIAKKNLHLTLKFFPHASERKVEKIEELLKKIKLKPFEVKLDNLGYFPNANDIRVLWVGLKPDEGVMNLQGDVDSVLSSIFEIEKRFNVHLSLGRVKLVKDKEKFLERLKEIKIPNLKFKICGFELIESKLTKDGPVYKILNKF